MKLSKIKLLSIAQQEAIDRINNRKIVGPDIPVGPYGVFEPPEDYTAKYENGHEYTWYANRVYGTFNTTTLKALEKKGLIKVHFFGGNYGTDIIEIL